MCWNLNVDCDQLTNFDIFNSLSDKLKDFPTWLLSDFNVDLYFNIGLCGTHISKWVTSVAHLHILFSTVSCYLQCHNHDAWKIKGDVSTIPLKLKMH